jgi:fatty-acyl-CoA synthase
VPDRKYGEEIMAWIRLRPGADVGEDHVRQYCRERISHFKVPRYIRFVDEFPMTVTGKIQKFKMREIAVAELALEGELSETA